MRRSSKRTLERDLLKEWVIKDRIRNEDRLGWLLCHLKISEMFPLVWNVLKMQE